MAASSVAVGRNMPAANTGGFAHQRWYFGRNGRLANKPGVDDVSIPILRPGVRRLCNMQPAQLAASAMRRRLLCNQTRRVPAKIMLYSSRRSGTCRQPRTSSGADAIDCPSRFSVGFHRSMLAQGVPSWPDMTAHDIEFEAQLMNRGAACRSCAIAEIAEHREYRQLACARWPATSTRRRQGACAASSGEL